MKNYLLIIFFSLLLNSPSQGDHDAFPRGFSFFPKYEINGTDKHYKFNSNLIDGLVLFGKKDLRQHWTLTEQEINEFIATLPKNSELSKNCLSIIFKGFGNQKLIFESLSFLWSYLNCISEI